MKVKVMTNETSPTTSALPGPNVLLMGPGGTGKTHSLGTLADAGVHVFYVGLEPGLESLLGYYTDRNLPVRDTIHWHIVEAPKASFLDQLDSATKINSMSLDTLAKMNDPKKSNYNQFIKILECLNGYVDQRTGKNYGPVDDWSEGMCLAMDGLTGLGRAAMSLVVGGKPVKNISDWGIAQDQVEKILRMLTDNCRCWFTLISHIERETDQVLGGIKLTVATLGAKLSPKLTPMFSDVILCVREGAKWSWDTANAQADVKTRNLKVASGLPPSFAPIVDKWKSRGGVLVTPVVPK